MRRKTELRDRLSISVHASDSDLKHTRRTAGFGMDRQLSISRWMADAVNEQCGGKIQRTVSSHETLMQEQPASPEREESRQQPASLDFLHTVRPLNFFQRAQSQKSLSKPVRKRSSGPEGLIKDVLRALSERERNEMNSSRTSTDTSNKSGVVNLDDHDIEEETDDDDVEFHSDDDEDLAEDSSTMPLPDAPLNTPTNQEPLLRERSSRWDASSPVAEEKKDVPPLDHLMRGLSSRKMPVPPPPPFSPANSNSELESVVPQDLFQSNSNVSEGGSTPCKPLRMISSHLLRESVSKANMSSPTPPLAPLAAASAAIAIVTASMEETDEEVELNDLVPKERTMNAENSSHDNKTDAATAGSAASIDDQDSWQDYSDEEISVDASMLSASNTTFTSFTTTTHQSKGKSKDAVGSSGLAAYMNKAMREAEESKKPKHYKPTSLSSYMNWAKQRKQEEDEGEDKSKKSNIDYSCKSFAEDTFDTFGTYTIGTFDTFESPKAAQKTLVPLPLKACSDHHPVLNLSRRDPSIVPPSMPKRSVSSHEKIDIAPRTPKTPKSRVTQQQALPNTKSPSGDRVQQLLDANKRKCKYSRCHRRCSAPGNFGAGVNMQQQRFPRRVSLDHATYSPESSVARRRASVDVSILSSSNTTPPTSTDNCSAKQQQLHPSLTPTITKTTRRSPNMSRNRKQLIDEVKGVPDLQSPEKTPVNTRNLTSAAETFQNSNSWSHVVE